MEYLLIIVVILLATLLLVGIGDKFNLPWPVLLTLLTTGVILVPSLPNPEVNADIILPLFLPPLLWAIGSRVSWGSLRRQWRSILIYSIILTTFSAFAVAWSAWMLIPGASFALALAVGAAVAPPDPVAVEAVAEPVGIPRRLVSVIQTEGLFNDAVSLVLFEAALSAIEGHESLSTISLFEDFLVSALVATAIGFICGTIGNFLARNIKDSAGRSGMTIVIPFAVYLLAEHFGASGVIAVVIAAVQMNSYKVDAFNAEDRFTNKAFWRVLEMLVTGLAFGLIGLQAGELVYETTEPLLPIIGNGIIISAVAVGVRFTWILLVFWWTKIRKNDHATPRTFAEVLVMTWSGMRGLVTLALTLTIPNFDESMHTHAVIIVITVLFFTMVFPGLTLPLLVRILRVNDCNENDDRAEHQLLLTAQRAALESLRESAHTARPEIVSKVTEMCATMVQRLEAAQERPENDSIEELEASKERRAELRKVSNRSIQAAQKAVLEKRNRYDLEVINSVLHRLDTLEFAGQAGSTGAHLASPITTGLINMQKHKQVVEQERQKIEQGVISAEKNPDEIL